MMKHMRDPLSYIPHILALMVSLLFFFTAALKLLRISVHIDRFETLGYSTPLIYVLGAAEVTVAALLILPKTRILGCVIGLATLANIALSQTQDAVWVDLAGTVVTGALLVIVYFTSRSSHS